MVVIDPARGSRDCRGRITELIDPTINVLCQRTLRYTTLKYTMLITSLFLLLLVYSLTEKLAFVSTLTLIFLLVFFFNDTSTSVIFPLSLHSFFFFFLKETAPTELSPFPLHAALPI